MSVVKTGDRLHVAPTLMFSVRPGEIMQCNQLLGTEVFPSR